MSGIMIVMMVVMLVVMFGGGHKGVMGDHGAAAIETPKQKALRPTRRKPKTWSESHDA